VAVDDVLRGADDHLVQQVLTQQLERFLITRTLHRKGINMRYLGLLAAKIETEGDKVEL
jgi:hypothetical protein